MFSKQIKKTNILEGYNEENGTCLNENWDAFCQSMKEVYGLAVLDKNHEELWKKVKRFCTGFIVPIEERRLVEFLGEVLSLKDPVAHLSNSFRLNMPIFYETKNEKKIDFTIKTSDNVTLNIEVCSLRNEVIQEDIMRIMPLYKVSKEVLNNPDKKSKKIRKIAAKFRRFFWELSNFNEVADLENLKKDKDLRSIGLNRDKIDEIIEQNKHSPVGAQSAVRLIIKEELKRLTGIDPNEECAFKEQEGEKQFFNIIEHMIDKKIKKIMKKKAEIDKEKLVTLSEEYNPLYMLILDGDPYMPKTVVRDLGFVMRKVSDYLKNVCQLPFDRIFIVGLRESFWVFSKQKEWEFEVYKTMPIE